jgi:hypothetical protein
MPVRDYRSPGAGFSIAMIAPGTRARVSFGKMKVAADAINLGFNQFLGGRDGV